MKKIILITFAMLYYYNINAQIYQTTPSFINAQIYKPTPNAIWQYRSVLGESPYLFNPKTNNVASVISDASFGTRVRAYNGAFAIYVNNSDSVYTDDGSLSAPNKLGKTDTIGTTIGLPEQFIDGFYVSKSYYFSPNEPVVRALFKIRNASNQNRNTKIGIYSRLGSFNPPQLDTSLTDGVTLVDADRWMVVTTGSDHKGRENVINSWIRFGPGAVLSKPGVRLNPVGSFKGEYEDTFAISVPANDYVLIAMFNQLDTLRSDARAHVVNFNNVATMNSLGYLTGISNDDLLKVVNWDFSSLRTTASRGYLDVSSEINVYPVPSSSMIHVALNNNFSDNVTISIKDMSGTTKMTVHASSSINELLDISLLEAGLYIVEIKGQEKIAYKKIIKN